MSKSIKSCLSIQIKPCRNTYHKPYPLTFDFMEALHGWRVPLFISIVVMILSLSWNMLAHFMLKCVKCYECTLFSIVSYWYNIYMVYIITYLFYWFMGWVRRNISRTLYFGVKTRLSHLTSIHQERDEFLFC